MKEQGTVCAEKTEGRYFPIQTKQTRLISHIYHMAFGSFSSLFIVLCTSPLSFLVSLHVDTCYLLGIHFPCLHIVNSFQEKQHCSRTCYCSNFSNEHYPIPFYFRLYYFRNFPDKTCSPLKKCIALAQCLGGQYTFFRTS